MSAAPEPAAFELGDIHDVAVRALTPFEDDRGWLAELFRSDELDAEFHPAMTYISWTRPGVARGPHEHRDQADLFFFLGPGRFEVVLWDARADSPTRGRKQVVLAGEGAPLSVLVPAGVVHAYRCVSDNDGMVINAPNRLYRGEGKAEEVDEIRHEADPDFPYQLDPHELD